jgi:hypothetical protein
VCYETGPMVPIPLNLSVKNRTLADRDSRTHRYWKLRHIGPGEVARHES